MCWVNREMAANRNTTTHKHRYQQNYKSSVSSVTHAINADHLTVKVYEMTTEIFSDGVLACLNSCVSLHSKLAENRPAVGPFTSNGKHNKTCGITIMCSVTSAVQTVLAFHAARLWYWVWYSWLHLRAVMPSGHPVAEEFLWCEPPTQWHWTGDSHSEGEDELLVNVRDLDLHILLFLHKNVLALRIWKYSVVQLEPIVVVQFSTIRVVTVLVLWPDVPSFGISYTVFYPTKRATDWLCH